MHKRLCLSCLMIICLILTGCIYTVDAHRIWVLCKQDGNTMYYYNDVGEYIRVSDGIITSHSGAGLTQLPALHFQPEEFTPVFEYVLPGHFKGTLRSVSGYVNIISGEYDVVYSDPYTLEMYVTTPDDVIRIIFKVSGDIQIYAKSGNVPFRLSNFVSSD